MVGYLAFKKDSKYLIKNNLLRILILILAVSILFFFRGFEKQELLFIVPIILLSFNAVWTTALGGFAAVLILTSRGHIPGALELLVFPSLAILLTFPLTGLYHCASHESMRPRWLNRWLGELIGLLHMSSLDEWAIIHTFHHAHADDLEKDPHPPAGQGFFQFMRNTAKNIGKCFGRHFVKIHGIESLPNLIKASRMARLRQLLLSLFWFLLLGPVLYTYLFAVNIIFKKFHYAWFNWSTHIKVGEEVQIVNLNEGLYRVINFITFNLYCHRGHHNNPVLFRPKG